MVVSDSVVAWDGGGVHVSDGSLLITASTITGNSTTHGELAFGRGGGIFFDGGEAAGAALTIHHSTITGNRAGVYGGGVHSPGRQPVTVTASTVTGNTALSEVSFTEGIGILGEGGGISAGQLTVVDSTVAGNNAGSQGGGLQGQTVTVTGSTIAHNVADAGGGIAAAGSPSEDRVLVESSTVGGNRADVGGGLLAASDLPVEVTLSTVAGNAAVIGGGLSVSGDLALQGTIVAMNPGGDLAGEGSATLDHSLVRDPRGFPYTDTGESIIGEDPLLGPQADNGGPTTTMLPASNSPVIDQGNAFGETVDQRGSPRPADGADIGAVELTEAELTGLPQVGNVAPPLITGRVRVGRTLRTDGGTWEPAGVTRGYQWLRDGVPIPGATSASYTLTGDDFGWHRYSHAYRKRISLRVTAEAEGHRAGSMASDYTGYVRRGVLTMSERPRVTGRPKVGSVLRARPRMRAISPRPTGVFVRWYIRNRPLDHLRGARRLELMPWMRGKRVKVTFSYRPPAGYKPLSRVVRLHRRIR